MPDAHGLRVPMFLTETAASRLSAVARGIMIRQHLPIGTRMQDIIEQCHRRFRAPPRRLPLLDRFSYLRIPQPEWLREDPSDALKILFDNLGTTYKHGRIVWGHLIQANNLMFEDGEVSCPGELLYSLDDNERADPQVMSGIARQLYALKGTSPSNAELLSIADYLADEMIRVYGLRVPPTISPDYRCRISTTYFYRQHLPGGRLMASMMPILVNPREPYVALPLPGRYWPESLLSWWLATD